MFFGCSCMRVEGCCEETTPLKGFWGINHEKKPKFGSFFTGMSAKHSGDATLRDTTRALALLSTDAAAVKGLQAVIKAGRRQGLDTVQIAGVTLTSAAAAAGSKRSQQRNGGCASGSRDQAEPSKRSRRKSQAQRERDAERSSVTRGCGRSFFQSCALSICRPIPYER